MKNNSFNRTSYLVLVALFCAIAYLCVFLIPIRVQFLTLDIKDAVMTIGALYLGPIAGIVMSALVSFLEFATFSSTGVYGLLMNFLGSATFTVVASLIYTKRKSLVNAVIAMASAVAAMTAVMLMGNLVITPYFMHTDVQTVVGMILPLLLPFNLAKGVLNAALTMLLYKPISVALKHTHLGGNQNAKLNKNSVIVAVCSVIVILLVLAFLFFALHATV